MIGLVTKSTGTIYTVYFSGAEVPFRECPIKGNFRIRGIRTTNPITVGDIVEVESLADGTHWITAIQPRRNYIIRRATNLSKEAHILASNIDQVALLVTLEHPHTSTTFIDRFLATAEAYRIPAVLIFNKIDLLDDAGKQQLDRLRQLYESLGYSTYAISAKTLDPTMPFFPLTDKITLLSGNSGVGKSTLLNALLGRDLARTGVISNAHDKGRHTTTFSEMFPLVSDTGQPVPHHGGWIIDTPGIKGFGTVEMQPEEVSHYFREIFAIGADCKYSNCLHTGEPGCKVQDAVVDGQIALSRYESYLSILDDCTESKYR